MAVLQLSGKNFKDTIDNNDFVIVDFWAPWCEPCVAFTPAFEEVAAKHPDIVFGMVNIDTDPDIGEFFNVEKIPGLMVVREQAVIHAQVGEISAAAVEKIIAWARDYEMGDVRRFYAQQDAQEEQTKNQ